MQWFPVPHDLPESCHSLCHQAGIWHLEPRQGAMRHCLLPDPLPSQTCESVCAEQLGPARVSSLRPQMSQSKATKLSPLFPVRTLGESLVQKIKILLTHLEKRCSLGAAWLLLGKMSFRENHRAPLHTDSYSSLYFQLLRHKHTQSICK